MFYGKKSWTTPAGADYIICWFGMMAAVGQKKFVLKIEKYLNNTKACESVEELSVRWPDTGWTYRILSHVESKYGERAGADLDLVVLAADPKNGRILFKAMLYVPVGGECHDHAWGAQEAVDDNGGKAYAQKCRHCNAMLLTAIDMKRADHHGVVLA